MFATKTLKRLVNLFFSALIALSLIILIALSRRVAVTDSLLYISAASQLVLGFMGVLLALHEDWAKRHRSFIIAAFALAALFGFYTTIRQARDSARETAHAQTQAAEANIRLSNSLDNLNKSTAEISRVQRLNTQLQEQLLTRSGEIAELSQQGIDQITGGDSFCVFLADPTNKNAQGRHSVTVFVYGKYPMVNVRATIQPDGNDPQYPYSLYDILSADTLLPGAHGIDGVDVTLGRYIIVTWSRRGLITQTMELKMKDGQTVQTVHVSGDGKQLYPLRTKSQVRR